MVSWSMTAITMMVSDEVIRTCCWTVMTAWLGGFPEAGEKLSGTKFEGCPLSSVPGQGDSST
jgi:hypothetical protein